MLVGNIRYKKINPVLYVYNGLIFYSQGAYDGSWTREMKVGFEHSNFFMIEGEYYHAI